MLHEERFIRAITEHEQLMQDLRRVQSLHLPQCYIGAGYIRNYIWDVLHGYDLRELHSDIDVVYYDAQDLREARDIQLEQQLREETGNAKWSVKTRRECICAMAQFLINLLRMPFAIGQKS